MQKCIRTALDHLLFSNLFIGLCAVAQVAFTYQALSIHYDLKVAGLIFFATVAMYNFSMLLSKPSEPQKSPYRRVRWIFSHQRFFISLSIVATMATAALAMLLSFPALILLGLLALVSIAYNLPLLQQGKQRIGLRNIPGLKIFIIAGVWSCSTVLLPLMEWEYQSGTAMSLPHTPLLLLQRFLLVMALTIPFDIRDIYQDQTYALKTIPAYFGAQRAYALCFGILMVALLTGWPVFTLAAWLAMAIGTLLAAWLIFRSRWKKNEYYYFLYLDGTLMLPWLMLQLISWWL